MGDASYREDGGCDALTEVSALAEGYSPTTFRRTAEELIRLRYPVGLPFLEAQDDTALRTWFSQGTETFADLVAGLEAAVHEGSHIWGARRLNGRTATYRIAPNIDVQVRWLRNFHRSELLALHANVQRDTYATTYLTGSSGAQGFNTLLDEYDAYAHSLAVRWCPRDLMPSNQRVSARDGMLTMMYYVELYRSLARTKYPKDYAAILADPGHRRVVTLVWDRAEYLLRRTATFPELGLQDDHIAEWVYTPELVAEIAKLTHDE